MTMTDPIADFLTRLRNANSAYHDEVTLPHSKIKANIAEILQAQGLGHGPEPGGQGDGRQHQKQAQPGPVESGGERRAASLDRLGRPEPRHGGFVPGEERGVHEAHHRKAQGIGPELVGVEQPREGDDGQKAYDPLDHIDREIAEHAPPEHGYRTALVSPSRQGRVMSMM